jgi:hypothetical protein
MYQLLKLYSITWLTIYVLIVVYQEGCREKQKVIVQHLSEEKHKMPQLGGDFVTKIKTGKLSNMKQDF